MGTVLEFKRKVEFPEWPVGCDHYGWLAFEVGIMPVECDIMWHGARKANSWDCASAMRRRLNRISDLSNS
jgi:hypothetical protein